MGKNLVFDLEGTLISSLAIPRIHRQAREVLERAQVDFDKTCLWTLGNFRRSLKVLKDADLLHFFDRILGTYVRENKAYTLDCNLNSSSLVCPRFLEYDTLKDLSRLGSYEDYVLIDDSSTAGRPEKRVIRIPMYTGSDDHELLPAYERAVSLFDK